MGNIIYYQLLVGLSVFCQDLGTPSDKIWPGPPSYSELPAVKKVRIINSFHVTYQTHGKVFHQISKH